MVRLGPDVCAALIGGALYALALPPFDLPVAGWFVLVPLLLRVRNYGPARGFVAGALLGAASAATVTWYASEAAARFFGIGVVPAVLALWLYYFAVCGTTFGLFGMGATVLIRQGRGAILTVPALWVTAELIRGRFLGQPWGLLGYTQHSIPSLIQIASFTGVYGVSFLLALASTGIADAIEAVRHRSLRVLVWALTIPTIVIASCWISGAIAMRRYALKGGKPIGVALVQTSITPERTWTRAYADRQIGAHVSLTESLATDEPHKLIVWPENAVPRYLEGEPQLRAWLVDLAARYNADLLVGAPRHDAGKTFNSVHLIRPSGEHAGVYDKRLLVPFAESTPLIGSPPEEQAENPTSFSPGSGSGILRGALTIGTTICHEILYPELVRQQVLDGAWLLVTVANDGWMDGGYGIASRQAFAMSAFRAVETRRYLVRAALTGVSGVIDPRGVVVASMAPGTSGATTVKAGARSMLSPYVRYGDAFALFCALTAGTALEARRARFRTQRLPEAPAHSHA